MKWFVVLYVAGAAVAITISDPNSNNSAHVQVGSSWDSSTIGMVWGYVQKIPGGSGTTTATAASAVTNFSIYCAEYSGLDASNPFLVAAGMNKQVNPATSADAITSGLMTPTQQPGMVVGITVPFNSAANIAVAGTGFTSRTAVWNLGSGALARPEDKRFTDLSNIAATFTVGAATDTFFTVGALFAEVNTSDIGLANITSSAGRFIGWTM
jgi:hypothetical protein